MMDSNSQLNKSIEEKDNVVFSSRSESEKQDEKLVTTVKCVDSKSMAETSECSNLPKNISILNEAECFSHNVDDMQGNHKVVIIKQEVLVKPLQESVENIVDKITILNNTECESENLLSTIEHEAQTLNELKVSQDVQIKPSNEQTANIVTKEKLNVDDGAEKAKVIQDEQNVFEQQLDESQLNMADETIVLKNSAKSSTILNAAEEAMETEVSVKTDEIQTKMTVDSLCRTSKSDLNPASTSEELNETENNKSSLALLAQYDSDSDSDVCEVPVNQSYQNRCVEINSDSENSDVEFLGVDRDSINLDLFNDNEDEVDEETYASSRPPKVKGELGLEDLPPIEDLHITVSEEECIELGQIHSIVEQLVLVNALPGTVPLNLETVLFRDKGKQVLGEIFDVLGQVSDPLYCVRFNSNKEIKEKGIKVGQTIYVAPRTKHTQFVILSNLMKERGSDASWEHDVEPPPRYIEYSDDEEERSARRPRRNRSRTIDLDGEEPKRPYYGGNSFTTRGSYAPRRPYGGNYISTGGRLPHPPPPPSNYNIVGNSWHSNFHQTPMNHHQRYQMPTNYSPVGYRPPFQGGPNPHPPVNPGLVINPYAVYPPPPIMQQPLFPPPLHQLPPPPPPRQ